MIEMIRIANVGRQVVKILYGPAEAFAQNSTVARNAAGELAIAPGSWVSIEASRVDLAQLNSLRNKSLLTFSFHYAAEYTPSPPPVDPPVDPPPSLPTAPPDGTTVTQIEEDWELVNATYNVDTDAPQVGTSMYPSVDDYPYVWFILNYRDYPSYDEGGMEIEVWGAQGASDPVAYIVQGTAKFQHDNETTTWTQRLNLVGSTLYYKVLNGVSQSMEFGSNFLVAFPTALTDLSGYDPEVSVLKSGVTYAANMVTSFALVAVRYYAGSTLVAEDTTRRAITLM